MGPRPRQAATGSELAHTKAPSPRHRKPPIHQRPECGSEEIGPTFDGGPKLIQEKEQPKTQPDTKTFPLMLMRTHKNTHTQRKDTQHNNGRYTLIHTRHTYLTSPRTQEGVPFLPGRRQADRPTSHPSAIFTQPQPSTRPGARATEGSGNH
ncbi:hypothetical protein XENORESO_001732 [Xenotaenia resolanae]|uniref:Uncharacterized protein n=1 Tax=Xenotaenia resolanae TaxID=208358 RepID=A0ABV0VUI0_9TELE